MPRPRRTATPLARPRAQRAVALLGLFALVLAVAAGRGFAAEKGHKTITVGKNNTPQQRAQLFSFFGAGPNDQIVTIGVEDTQRAMAGIFDKTLINSAYSSTSLAGRALDDGLDVTTRNIDLVTPGLYAMALVTAGIGDATLVVAAPDGLTGVQGMTALIGVFQTWSMNPCDSANTDKTRQRLALEELTLTVAIGNQLVALGFANAIHLATALVLQTQQTIVIQDLTTAVRISQAVAAQERALNVQVPADRGAKPVELVIAVDGERTVVVPVDLVDKTAGSGDFLTTNRSHFIEREASAAEFDKRRFAKVDPKALVGAAAQPKEKLPRRGVAVAGRDWVETLAALLADRLDRRPAPRAARR